MVDNLHSSKKQASTVPIVAIGASAGGLEQLQLLLGHIPPDTGAAFVVVQHLDPNHDSKLTELLAQASDLPVVTIDDHMAAQANRVHVLPPGHRLTIDEDGELHLVSSKEREAKPTLIDGFFRNLSEAPGRRAIGIILSGSGSDGARGLKAIRSAGGLAMAQYPNNAEFDGMPRAAAKHASPDCVLDTADMIAPLSKHLRLNLTNDEQSTNEELETSKEELQSANEELTTVNTELETRMAELENAHTTQTQLQLLADALPQMVAFVDPDNNIQYGNAAFLNWFGTSAGDLAGRSVSDILGQSALETLAPTIKSTLDRKAVSCHLALAHSSGGEYCFQTDHIPYVADGKVLGFYLLMTNITAQQNSDATQRQHQDRLVYIQRMATIGEMSSTLAHDLNQPLSAINSYASALTRMLHAGKAANETTPILGKIADQVKRASTIVGDVRDFVGRGEQAKESLDLHGLLHNAISLTASRARRLGVDTRISEHAPLPAVRGDTVKIQQVLINVINNALDALETVDNNQRTLWLSSAVPDAAHVQITVADSGPGIPSTQLESIFDSYQSTKLDGMGMGLAISRSIARRHGGELWAESQPGHGTTFYLSLPVGENDSDDSG